MILIDANLLLYAYNTSSPHHQAARAWLEEMLSRPEPVGIAWDTILAFLRIATNARAFENPLSIAEAAKIVSEWVDCPAVRMVAPGPRHWSILKETMAAAQVRGPLVMDADLAALALEHGLTLCTADRDFTRFAGLQTSNPLES